jgi:hypothetical protein
VVPAGPLAGETDWAEADEGPAIATVIESPDNKSAENPMHRKTKKVFNNFNFLLMVKCTLEFF